MSDSDMLNTLNVLNINDFLFASTLANTLRNGMYNEKLSKTIISFINKQLSNAATREKGFELLLKLLPDCSKNILDENYSVWINFAISHHVNEHVSASRLQALASITTLCQETQDFHKNMVSSLLVKIIDTCVNTHRKSSEAFYALKCLIVCLRYFTSTCITHKKKIDGYVYQFLDEPISASVLDEAASCMHYLNQVGGSGPGGIQHVKCFTESFEKLVNTLNFLYNELFADVNEFQDNTASDTNIHQFNPIPTNLNSIERFRIITRRLRNVTAFITKALECDYKVKKSFNPQLLIGVINRGLAVHVHADQDLNKALFSIIVQEHQVELLHLLKALIGSIRYHFIRFSSIKLLQDYLARTNNCSCFRQDSSYKTTVYEVLSYWILNSGEQVDCITYDKIIRNIIVDINPVKSVVALNLTNTEQISSKAKKKAIKEKILSSADVNNFEVARVKETKEIICYQALHTLELLLTKIPLNVKDNTCALLFETLMKVLLDVSVGVHLLPYTDKKCITRLYQVFIAIYNQNRKLIDIGLVVNILCIGERSFDTEISNICTSGLAALEKICQPITPSLYLSTNNNEKEKRPKVVVTSNEECFIHTDKNPTPEPINEEEPEPINDVAPQLIKEAAPTCTNTPDLATKDSEHSLPDIEIIDITEEDTQDNVNTNGNGIYHNEDSEEEMEELRVELTPPKKTNIECVVVVENKRKLCEENVEVEVPIKKNKSEDLGTSNDNDTKAVELVNSNSISTLEVENDKVNDLFGSFVDVINDD